MDGAYYGDEQAQLTMNRSAYGDVPAALMQGSRTVYGGAAAGLGNMYADIGAKVMPASYTPAARYYADFSGMTMQTSTFGEGLKTLMGVGPDAPRGTRAGQFYRNIVSDFGERVAGGAVGAATAATGIGVGTLAGIGIATAIGGPVGFVGGIAAAMAGSTAHEAVNNAIGQRRDIQNYIEQTSYRYVGAGSPMADPNQRGMSRVARREAAETIRNRDVADPEFNTTELTQILQQSTQLGLFTGMNDMKDFKKKFKEITESVKEVTKVLNTTLEEGLKTLKDLKGIGIDPSQAKSIVNQANTFGAMSGRTAQEMVNLGLQGAEMFRGTGVEMDIGFKASQMNLASIRATRDAGILSQAAIAQAGGEEAMAMQQTARGLSFAQTMAGRGFNAAFAGPGGFNAAAFGQQVMGGGGGYFNTAMQAAQNLGDPAALIKFTANQEQFVSKMGQQFGGQGLQISMMANITSQAKALQGIIPGITGEDSFRYIAKSSGIGETEIEGMMAKMKGADATAGSQKEAIQRNLNEAVTDNAYRSNAFYKLGEKVSDVAKGIVDKVAAPLNRRIDDFAENMGDWWRTKAAGVSVVTTTGVSSKAFEGLDIERGSNADVHSMQVSLNKVVTLSNTAEKYAEMLQKDRGTLGITDKDMKEGNIVLDEKMFGKNITVSSKALMSSAVTKNAKRISQTIEEAGAVLKAADVSPAMLSEMNAKLHKLVSGGALTKESSIEDISKSLYGKPSKELSDTEFATMQDAALKTSGGLPQLEGAFKRAKALGEETLRVQRDITTEAKGGAAARIKEEGKKLESNLDVDLGGVNAPEKKAAVAAMVIAAAKFGVTDERYKEKAALASEAGIKEVPELTKSILELTTKAAKGGEDKKKFEETKAAAMGIVASSRDIEAIKTQEGKVALKDSLTSEITSAMRQMQSQVVGADKETKIEIEQKIDKAKSVLTKFEKVGIAGLSTEDVKLLEVAGVKSQITSQAKQLSAIREMYEPRDETKSIPVVDKITGKPVMDKITGLPMYEQQPGAPAAPVWGKAKTEQFREQLTATFGPSVRPEEIAKMVTKATTSKEGFESVAKDIETKIYQSQRADVEIKGGTTTPSGGGDLTSAGPMKLFDQQTQINEETLSALKSLAGRLRLAQ